MFRRWGLFLAVILAFLVLAGAFWYNSDADLRAEDAAMRAAGFPATWAEVPPFVAPPEVVRKVGEVRALAERIGHFKDDPSNPHPWLFPGPGRPPPPEAQAWLASIPTKDWEELRNGIDQLPDGPINYRNAIESSTLMPECQQDRILTRHLALRLALATDDEAPMAFARLMRVTSWLPNRSIWWSFVRSAEQHMIVSTLLQRGTPNSLSDKMISSLQKIVEKNWATRNDPWLGEYYSFRESMDRESSRGLEENWNMPPPWITEDFFPIECPQFIRVGFLRFAVRCGRANWLASLRKQMIVPLSKASDFRACWETMAAWHKSNQLLPDYDPRHRIEVYTGDGVTRLAQNIAQSQFYPRLFIAHLTNSPWPEDFCLPPGHPLQPIVRNGVIIGAYSVGPDGVDDGGDKQKDWCFALREKLGKTKASDPLEEPPAEAPKP